MKITILGTRGQIEPSAPYHSKKSGVLIDDTILLDCGDERFLAYQPQALLITHLHPDHAFFVDKDDPPKLPCPVYAPELYEAVPITVPDNPFLIKDYKITPIPTVHSAKVVSTAYLIEHNDISVLYTGDLITIDKKYHRLFRDLSCVITEASFIRKGGLIRKQSGHTGLSDLIELFKQYTDTIILVHFGSWFYKDMPQARRKIKQLARDNQVDIIVGYDGLEIELI